MTVSLDNVEKYRWPVSTGKAGYSTPSGTFTATSMNEVWYSKEYDNAPMPHAVFFMKDGHAIHGTFKVKNLGKPVSHGCVRISPENAAILYGLVQGMAWRIQRWCLPALVRTVSIRSPRVGQARVGILPGHHPTPPITIDPRFTIDHRGAFYLGEDQVVEFVGLRSVHGAAGALKVGISGRMPGFPGSARGRNRYAVSAARFVALE